MLFRLEWTAASWHLRYQLTSSPFQYSVLKGKWVKGAEWNKTNLEREALFLAADWCIICNGAFLFRPVCIISANSGEGSVIWWIRWWFVDTKSIPFLASCWIETCHAICTHSPFPTAERERTVQVASTCRSSIFLHGTSYRPWLYVRL